MGCDIESLQAFLDNELGQVETVAVRRHLAGCSACRRELSRLRLLWLELEYDEDIEVPPELPFIRQQLIAGTRSARRETQGASGIGLWNAQKLAWQPVLNGVSQIPGPSQLIRLAKTTGMPNIVRGVTSALVIMAGKRRGRT